MTPRTYDRRRAVSAVRRAAAVCAAFVLVCVIAGCADQAGKAPAGAPERPGPQQAVPVQEGGVATMVVTSPAFTDGGRIPVEHCMKGVSGGKNVSRPLYWSDAARGTASFAVFVIDRHPVARNWVHWAVVGLAPSTTSLPAGASGSLASPARELVNTFGDRGYGGPMPPPGTGDHPYEVTVYALDVGRLEVPDAPTAADIERAVEGHVLGKGVITGVFSR
jgi:hypothetical protein